MGCDDELTEVPHRFSWEGISFDHFLVKESLHNNVGSTLLHQNIVQLSQQLMSPTLVTIKALHQHVVNLEGVVINQLPPLSHLYTVCSGGVNKPPAEALT